MRESSKRMIDLLIDNFRKGVIQLMKTMIKNPLFWSDIPDIDVIRVGSTYYMISTTMHMMPGCPIMKSKNLSDWELIDYVYDQLEDNDAHNLRGNQNIYGQGQWASNLRYHDGTFYVCFSCNDTKKFHVYQTEDIESGEWKRTTIPRLFHDPALLFDKDCVFVIYGAGDIRITELTKDLSAVKDGGIDQILLKTPVDGILLRCEGCRVYQINGYYYFIFIEWPKVGNQRRRQIAYRSKSLFGKYERKIIFDDDMGYRNQGIAQGAIVDTVDGEWYAILFQDHGAVGRIPYVLPVNWENDWPMIGIDGKAPKSFVINLPSSPSKPIVASDNFKYREDKLHHIWQWNHNPDDRLWTVTERKGYLRLKTGTLTDRVLQARNTLTQRTEGPICTGITLLDTRHMKPGDHAGLIALQSNFGTVGVKVTEEGKKFVAMMTNGESGDSIIEKQEIESEQIHLKVIFDFQQDLDRATFYYSLNGEKWIAIGKPLQMKYTLDHFMGYRIGLFNYATREVGGYVDFAYFHYYKEDQLIKLD